MHSIDSLTRDEEKLMQVMLKMHPKYIAHQRSISILCKCDLRNFITYKNWIPLGYHEYSDEETDPLFTNNKFVKYKDGSLYLCVELMFHSGDGYCVGHDTEPIAHSTPQRRLTNRHHI